MLDIANKTAIEDGGKVSLRDRRLESIKKGDFNWMGKGFLAVIKKDCENPKLSEKQKTGPPD